MFLKAKNKVAMCVACSLLGALLFMQGCPILIVAIYAAYSDDGVTITAEIPKGAPDIFEVMKKMANKDKSEQAIPFKVINIDEENYTIAIEDVEGLWYANYFLIPIDANNSQLIIQGTDDVRSKEESEALVLTSIKNLCDELGVKYTVIGSQMKEGSSN